MTLYDRHTPCRPIPRSCGTHPHPRDAGEGGVPASVDEGQRGGTQEVLGREKGAGQVAQGRR